ncbi:hypothetical protein MMC09_002436 [Bachmanniomyces sp. S44760]|nr:hypothetical protein [Bachmanniomyces sp. S44760]
MEGSLDFGMSISTSWQGDNTRDRGPSLQGFDLERIWEYDDTSWIPITGNNVNAPGRHRPSAARASRPPQVSTPSSFLVQALEDTGHASAVPLKYKGKVDLSKVSPLLQDKQQRGMIRPPTLRQGSIRLDPSASRDLPAILAAYIQSISPYEKDFAGLLAGQGHDSHITQSLSVVLNDGNMASLQAKGYDAPDLMRWTWILTAASSEQAAYRLLALSNLSKNDKPIPTFVLLFLLRRPHINSHALKSLIVHTWDRLLNRHNPQWASDASTAFNPWGDKGWNKSSEVWRQKKTAQYSPLSETTIVVLVIRLLRHARKVWPGAVVNIGTMFSQFVSGIGPQTASGLSQPMTEKASIRLSFVYNKVLAMLSLPSSQNPFRDLPHIQRAQFVILKRMNDFEPTLTVNREGYRAITRTQLAHRKTFKERDWADLKAKSWPPWKEAKTAFDLDKGEEFGTSRARESVGQLNVAGYATGPWEHGARILAGWDTDNSPTIQTRAFNPTLVRVYRGSADQIWQEAGVDVWTSRIRATRTLDEAWSCFVAYRRLADHPVQDPYYAMFEKLMFDHKRQSVESRLDLAANSSSEELQDYPALPGDGMEVHSKPVSPRDAVYLSVPAPTIEAFFDSMISDNVKPSSKFLAFLLKHADTLSNGIKYLRSSNLPQGVIQALLGRYMNSEEETRKRLQAIPDYLFGSFIRLLSRHGLNSESSSTGLAIRAHGRNSIPINSEETFSARSLEPINPIFLAFKLMNARKPLYRPAWESLIAGLARRNLEGGGIDSSMHDMWTWKAIAELTYQMNDIHLDVDFKCFQTLCIGLEKATLASQNYLEAMRTPAVMVAGTPYRQTNVTKEMDSDTAIRIDAEQIRSSGLPWLKQIFRKLVSSEYGSSGQKDGPTGTYKIGQATKTDFDPASLLPRLLEVPGPAMLHSFIRVLGLHRDYIGILGLIRWMAHFAPELKAVADELRNGSKMTRRCLIAVRVFLEKSAHDLDLDAESLEYGKVSKDNEATINNNFVEHDGNAESDALTLATIGDQVKGIVNGVEGWGGWPTDKEVRAYDETKSKRRRVAEHKGDSKNHE